VEAHTVAALDVIAAFAVPNPGCSSRAVGFFGFGGSKSHLFERVTQPTLDRLLAPIFSAAGSIDVSPAETGML
jgi:hypothetical protein